MNTISPLYTHDTLSSPNRGRANYYTTTKSKIFETLSSQDNNSIQDTTQGGYVIDHTSKYIPLSVVQQSDRTAIDSVVELDDTTTHTILDNLNTKLEASYIYDTTYKEDITLSLLQQILDDTLGIINNVSSAESEQQQAIKNTPNGIIQSKDISQKMCTMRAGYTAQVLGKLGWEATTICGNMEGEGHARNILKSPSGQTLMLDPMNPKTNQGYRCINSTPLSSLGVYERLKNGTYTSSIVMNQQTYHPGIAA